MPQQVRRPRSLTSLSSASDSPFSFLSNPKPPSETEQALLKRAAVQADLIQRQEVWRAMKQKHRRKQQRHAEVPPTNQEPSSQHIEGLTYSTKKTPKMSNVSVCGDDDTMSLESVEEKKIAKEKPTVAVSETKENYAVDTKSSSAMNITKRNKKKRKKKSQTCRPPLEPIAEEDERLYPPHPEELLHQKRRLRRAVLGISTVVEKKGAGAMIEDTTITTRPDEGTTLQARSGTLESVAKANHPQRLSSGEVVEKPSTNNKTPKSIAKPLYKARTPSFDIFVDEEQPTENQSLDKKNYKKKKTPNTKKSPKSKTQPQPVRTPLGSFSLNKHPRSSGRHQPSLAWHSPQRSMMSPPLRETDPPALKPFTAKELQALRQRQPDDPAVFAALMAPTEQRKSRSNALKGLEIEVDSVAGSVDASELSGNSASVEEEQQEEHFTPPRKVLPLLDHNDELSLDIDENLDKPLEVVKALDAVVAAEEEPPTTVPHATAAVEHESTCLGTYGNEAEPFVELLEDEVNNIPPSKTQAKKVSSKRFVKRSCSQMPSSPNALNLPKTIQWSQDQFQSGTPPTSNYFGKVARAPSHLGSRRAGEVALWTGELAGMVSSVQTFRLNDGRAYKHPPLPPGWTISVSRSKDCPYYRHPDFGCTFFPPIVLPCSGETSPGQEIPLSAFCVTSAPMQERKTPVAGTITTYPEFSASSILPSSKPSSSVYMSSEKISITSSHADDAPTDQGFVDDDVPIEIEDLDKSNPVDKVTLTSKLQTYLPSQVEMLHAAKRARVHNRDDEDMIDSISPGGRGITPTSAFLVKLTSSQRNKDRACILSDDEEKRAEEQSSPDLETRLARRPPAALPLASNIKSNGDKLALADTSSNNCPTSHPARAVLGMDKYISPLAFEGLDMTAKKAGIPSSIVVPRTIEQPTEQSGGSKCCTGSSGKKSTQSSSKECSVQQEEEHVLARTSPSRPRLLSLETQPVESDPPIAYDDVGNMSMMEDDDSVPMDNTSPFTIVENEATPFAGDASTADFEIAGRETLLSTRFVPRAIVNDTDGDDGQLSHSAISHGTSSHSSRSSLQSRASARVLYPPMHLCTLQNLAILPKASKSGLKKQKKKTRKKRHHREEGPHTSGSNKKPKSAKKVTPRSSIGGILAKSS